MMRLPWQPGKLGMPKWPRVLKDHVLVAAKTSNLNAMELDHEREVTTIGTQSWTIKGWS